MMLDAFYARVGAGPDERPGGAGPHVPAGAGAGLDRGAGGAAGRGAPAHRGGVPEPPQQEAVAHRACSSRTRRSSTSTTPSSWTSWHSPSGRRTCSGTRSRPGTSCRLRCLPTLAGYNTYTSKGLPPGPICSPALASIEAALNPEHEDRLPVLPREGQDGKTSAFAKTQAAARRQRREVRLALTWPGASRSRPTSRPPPDAATRAALARRGSRRTARRASRASASGWRPRASTPTSASSREHMRWLTGFTLGRGEEKVGRPLRRVPGGPGRA